MPKFVVKRKREVLVFNADAEQAAEAFLEAMGNPEKEDTTQVKAFIVKFLNREGKFGWDDLRITTEK